VNKLPQYYVGIDLGTTHTVVAFAQANNPDVIKLFELAQLIAPGQVAAKPLLPSVRYHAAEHELADDDFAVFQTEDRGVIGEAARLLGAKSSGRLVTSAKSWLSHPSVDHNAAILPWGSDDDVVKISPVAASASYLNHVRQLWGQQFPDAPLEQQDVVITVPASFDEGARSLTLEAAQLAGLASARLLEEPQAVCYDWLHRHKGNVTEELANTKLMLVCDIGGGTTDLTLIKVEPGQPEPKLTRIAVGEHLMLGGDNIDLALAHAAENRLRKDSAQLSSGEFSQLIEQCRNAKEKLLAVNAPDQVTLTLLGGGSKLIGAARSTPITQQEVIAIALDGFLPLTSIDDLPTKKRSGVVEFGLPYAAEPAISKHIAAFLNHHQQAAQAALQAESGIPDAILLNGGFFKSTAITQRLLALFKLWRSAPITLLANHHPELSVAFGAVSYAVARRSKQLKIGGGSARSYFLRVDAANHTQESSNHLGVCLLPKGSEENQEIILTDRKFLLLTGMPVRFDLVSFSGDNAFKAGELVDITDDFHSLPPLTAAFNHNAPNSTEQVVQLGVSQSDLGVLKIQCIAVDETNNPGTKSTQTTGLPQRWNVEFNIRKTSISPLVPDAELPKQFDAACKQIQLVFGAKSKQIDAKAVKNLRADLEKMLGDRNQWSSNLLRAFFMVLWEGGKYRRRSEHHERVWLSLTGFCLRPGFGWPLDDWRVKELWGSYPQGIQFSNEIQNWSEWWTLWRRIAGGLDEVAQVKLYHDIANLINPASARQANIAKLAKQRGYEDMVRLAGSLERLPLADKIQLGNWLIKRLQKSNESKQTWWALGRIGARLPFYGSAHNVIPVDIAAEWLTFLLSVDWKVTPEAAFAAMLIARNSGDRARDINTDLRIKVINQLKAGKFPQIWIDMVTHYQVLDNSAQTQFLGESLPQGLQLVDNVTVSV
jgi:molecular chaperone DnaK (HSP70)